MPRTTTAHSEHVRQRIVEAALAVMTQRGFRSATIHDVVREGGLSVGAIYTYFRGKDDLFSAACEMALEQELGALAVELSGAGTVREKLEISVRYWFDFLERQPDDARFLVEMWAEATPQPAIRHMLVRRRERLVGVGLLLLQEAVARHEIPAHLDLEDLARGFGALLDGLIFQRIEDGDMWRRARAERHALAFVDLLHATAVVDREPAPVEPAAPRTR